MALHTTHNLAYWHMPKTGGMTIYRLMRNLGTKYERINGYRRHGDIRTLPQSALKGRTLFGTVRDPWSWYTSLYQHARSGTDGIEMLKKWGNGSDDFQDVLYGMTHPLDIEELPLDIKTVTGTPSTQEEVNGFLSSGLGVCSWVFRETYGRPPKTDLFVDTYQINEVMAELLNVGIEAIESEPAQNRATHRPASAIENPRDLYTDEMKEWVAKADEVYIDTFKYEFFAPAPWSVLEVGEMEFPFSLR